MTDRSVAASRAKSSVAGSKPGPTPTRNSRVSAAESSEDDSEYTTDDDGDDESDDSSESHELRAPHGYIDKKRWILRAKMLLRARLSTDHATHFSEEKLHGLASVIGRRLPRGPRLTDEPEPYEPTPRDQLIGRLTDILSVKRPLGRNRQYGDDAAALFQPLPPEWEPTVENRRIARQQEVHKRVAARAARKADRMKRWRLAETQPVMPSHDPARVKKAPATASWGNWGLWVRPKAPVPSTVAPPGAKPKTNAANTTPQSKGASRREARRSAASGGKAAEAKKPEGEKKRRPSWASWSSSSSGEEEAEETETVKADSEESEQDPDWWRAFPRERPPPPDKAIRRDVARRQSFREPSYKSDDEDDDATKNQGAINLFGTKPQSKFTGFVVVKPVPNVVWRHGSRQVVAWEMNDSDAQHVSVNLFFKDQLTMILARRIVNQGYFGFTVPSSVPVGDYYRILVASVEVPGKYVFSKCFFKVSLSKFEEQKVLMREAAREERHPELVEKKDLEYLVMPFGVRIREKDPPDPYRPHHPLDVRNFHNYIGEINRKGVFHGHGVYSTALGGVLDGHWVDHEASGDGTLTYPHSAVYVGTFQNSRFHGQGTVTFINGTTYSGSWKHGKRHGPGVLKLSSGAVYEGQFENGVPHGHGTYISKDRVLFYEGRWAQGQACGMGKMVIVEKDEIIQIWPQASIAQQIIIMRNALWEAARKEQIRIDKITFLQRELALDKHITEVRAENERIKREANLEQRRAIVAQKVAARIAKKAAMDNSGANLMK